MSVPRQSEFRKAGQLSDVQGRRFIVNIKLEIVVVFVILGVTMTALMQGNVGYVEKLNRWKRD